MGMNEEHLEKTKAIKVSLDGTEGQRIHRKTLKM